MLAFMSFVLVKVFVKIFAINQSQLREQNSEYVSTSCRMESYTFCLCDTILYKEKLPKLWSNP